MAQANNATLELISFINRKTKSVEPASSSSAVGTHPVVTFGTTGTSGTSGVGTSGTSGSAGQIEAPYRPVSDAVIVDTRIKEHNLQSIFQQINKESPHLLKDNVRGIQTIDVGQMSMNETVSVIDGLRTVNAYNRRKQAEIELQEEENRRLLNQLREDSQAYKDKTFREIKESAKPVEPNEDGSYNAGQKVNIGSLLCYLTGFHIGNCDHKEVFRIKEYYENKKLTPEQVKKQIYGDLYKLKIEVDNFDDDKLWDQIKKNYGEQIRIRNPE